MTRFSSINQFIKLEIVENVLIINFIHQGFQSFEHYLSLNFLQLKLSGCRNVERCYEELEMLIRSTPGVRRVAEVPFSCSSLFFELEPI